MNEKKMISLSHKTVHDSTLLFTTLYNKVVDYVKNTHPYLTEISYEDYMTICDAIAFLISSCQVTELGDITLDAVLECLNDTSLS